MNFARVSGTGHAVRRARVYFPFPSPPFLVFFLSFPSIVKKYQNRLLLCLLPLCAPRATLDFSPIHGYRVRTSKFAFDLLGYRSVDVVCRPMSHGRWVDCVRNSPGELSMPPRTKPGVLDSDNSYRHHRRGDLRRTVLKEKPIELPRISTRPPNVGEGGVGRIRRTRHATVEGPARPSQTLRSCLWYAAMPQR